VFSYFLKDLYRIKFIETKINPKDINQKILFLYIGDRSAGFMGDKVIKNILTGTQ
jgi:hypothetical protein